MKKNRTRGFTLIEMLVVIVIIVAVASMVVGASLFARRKAKASHAQAEIAAMENALESFKSDNGFYPYSTANPQSLTYNADLLYTYLALGPKVYFVFDTGELRTGLTFTVSIPVDSCTPQTITVTNIWAVDPFGKPYNYFRSCSNQGSQNNQATFDLWSYGPSGTNGAIDMIANWKQ